MRWEEKSVVDSVQPVINARKGQLHRFLARLERIKVLQERAHANRALWENSVMKKA